MVKLSNGSFSIESVGDRVTKTGGRTSGFDYLRICLAAGVVFFHSRPTFLGITPHVAHAGMKSAVRAALQPVEWAIVPGFFVLSGFLVAGSLLRAKSLFEFGMLRVVRIVPALFVETLIFAFVAGPIVTEFSLSRYFTSSELWQYPLNIIGYIHYRLPGVFAHNPHPYIVNAQLWTIPGELQCYIVLGLAAALGVVQKKSILAATTLCSIVALTVFMPLFDVRPVAWSENAGHVDEWTLVFAFLMGALIYLHRDKIPCNIGIAVSSTILSYILMTNGTYQYLATITIAYVIVYVGIMDFPRSYVTATGDYSYGIYLYGFPIQQLLAYAFPVFRHEWFLFGFVIAMAVSFVCAALSWHLLESKVHAHRKAIIAASLRRFTEGQAWLRARLAKRGRLDSPL